jgi:ribosomal protein L32
MVKRLSKKTVKSIIEYADDGLSISYLSVCKNCGKLRGEHYGMNCKNAGTTLFSKDKYLTEAATGFYKTILKGKLKNTYISEQEAFEYGIRPKSQDSVWKI